MNITHMQDFTFIVYACGAGNKGCGHFRARKFHSPFKGYTIFIGRIEMGRSIKVSLRECSAYRICIHLHKGTGSAWITLYSCAGNIMGGGRKTDGTEVLAACLHHSGIIVIDTRHMDPCADAVVLKGDAEVRQSGLILIEYQSSLSLGAIPGSLHAGHPEMPDITIDSNRQITFPFNAHILGEPQPYGSTAAIQRRLYYAAYSPILRRNILTVLRAGKEIAFEYGLITVVGCQEGLLGIEKRGNRI